MAETGNETTWLVWYGSQITTEQKIAWQPRPGFAYVCAGPSPQGQEIHLVYESQSGSIHFSKTDWLFVFIEGVLFNRRELAAIFSAQVRPGYNDADLICLAYQEWGSQALERIKGRCTILLWDLQQDMFLAVRDRLGRYPLFYTQTPAGVAFSSSIQTILSRLGLPGHLNRPTLALGLSHLWPCAQETYYESILRVPPRHLLRLQPKTETLQKYWEPAPPGTPDDRMRLGDLEQFDGLLEQAVERYTSIGKTGIFLSGGLDSVSIAAVAVDLSRKKACLDPLALSLAFPDPESNEEARQRGVAAGLGVEQVILPFYDAAGKEGLIRSTLALTAQLSSPVQNSWLGAYYTLAQEGRQRGCEVILTGGGGDDWLTVNTSYMADLMRQLKISDARQFMRSLLKSYNTPAPAMLEYTLWDRGLRLLLGLYGRKSVQSIAPTAFRKYRRGRLFQLKLASIPDWVAPDPELRSQMEQRISEMVETELNKPEPDTPYGFYNLTSVTSNFDQALFSMDQEEDYEIGRRLGMVYGQPYWDTDLIEFLCRIPPRLLIVDGREKSIVRKTIARRFPNLGFEKQKKVMASKFYYANLVSGGAEAREKIGGLHMLDKYGIIGNNTSGDPFGEIIASPDFRIGYRAWELLNFEVWLQNHITQ